MTAFKFGPAANNEKIVFGAQRPGYGAVAPVPDSDVTRWIELMQHKKIRRVCCLLEDQLSLYKSDLIDAYQRSFGEAAVRSAPIKDFQLANADLLIDSILPFLRMADRLTEPVVVHCSGGIGRTGHVLAAWLVHGRSMTNDDAIQAVIRQGRNPYEAEGRNAVGTAKLHSLLDACRNAAHE